MAKDEMMFTKRMIDLSRQAYQKGIVTFSDYLNLNEQNIFHTCTKELYGSYKLFGGYNYAERQMIAFLPDALMFAINYPIACLKIEPLNQKFSEQLSHRDVLGSLMNLGIERGKIGDILVKDSQIYVFCHASITDFIVNELTRIRHTTVIIHPEEQQDYLEMQPNTERCEEIATSNRLDVLVAVMCHTSRSNAGELIKKGTVFINGKEISKLTYSCKEGEIISVRGFGRFRFLQTCGETKKGRLKIQYEKYI